VAEYFDKVPLYSDKVPDYFDKVAEYFSEVVNMRKYFIRYLFAEVYNF
jgi:hypothetical protein